MPTAKKKAPKKNPGTRVINGSQSSAPKKKRRKAPVVQQRARRKNPTKHYAAPRRRARRNPAADWGAIGLGVGAGVALFKLAEKIDALQTGALAKYRGVIVPGVGVGVGLLVRKRHEAFSTALIAGSLTAGALDLIDSLGLFKPAASAPPPAVDQAPGNKGLVRSPMVRFEERQRQARGLGALVPQGTGAPQLPYGGAPQAFYGGQAYGAPISFRRAA